MKKTTVVLLFVLAIAGYGYAQSWTGIRSDVPAPAKIQLVSSTISNSVVHFSLDGFYLGEVQTPRGTAYTVSVGKSTPLLNAGEPDLAKLTTALIIPDRAGMAVRIVSSSYKDFENLEVAPSKGVLTRDIDPSTVPYQYGKAYSVDKFFPGNLADAREPFIVRDLRGQTLIACPFQYNPVTKTLRVFYDLTVELYQVSSDGGFNPLARKGNEIRINPEFASVYSRYFLNMGVLDYTPLGEYGNMLVLCHAPFMTAMQPYVNWKNSIGIPAEMVDVAVAGTTAAQIKSFISNYYNTNGLTFVLLVGDAPQIPTNTGGGLGGPSDNAYGYLVGNDHYADLFVGRFSAENVAQVETQVERTLDYEKNPQYLTNDWYTTVLGIGSDQGPGDDGEMDYQHIRNLQTQCLGFTYTMNPELFDGSQGGNDAQGNPGPGDVTPVVNDGTGLILYTGHGSMTSWGTTGFSNNNVNQLTNMGKLPFIWSVACVNGEFMNGTCFAEAWLRATQSGEPTGAIAFLGSTINQSWNSPMEGEDEMVAILVENYPNNIKRSFAGLSINGCMKMIDSYGTDGANMADTWTVFGDPSLMVRTANPGLMTVGHDPTLFVGTTSLTVTCNVDGARATASLHDTILATGLISNNTVVLTFPSLQDPTDTVHLVVTAFNYLPDISDIPVITPNGPYIMYVDKHVNDTTGNGNDQMDCGEDILLNIYLKNVGIEATTALEVRIRSTDPYVTLIDSTENYGVLNPNETKKVADAFLFQASNQIPDGHSVEFEVISTDASQSWTAPFSIPALAPDLVLGDYLVIDSTGNNNGRLDPGETAFLRLYINNDGSSGATGVAGHLVAINPYVTVMNNDQVYGDLDSGSSVCKLFEVVIDSAAPEGQTAPFLLEISADKGITGTGSFDLVIGKIPVLIVDLDGNTNSGPAMLEAVESWDLMAEYNNLVVPDTMDMYSSVFVCLGVYPDNHILTNDEGTRLANYLNAGGRLYMEGADTWKYDPQTPVHPMFKLMAWNDGGSDLGTLNGINGTFTAGMTFIYAGDNQYIDRLNPESSAFAVLKNVSPVYYSNIAYDGGTYLTIGASNEFGGLTDGATPSTKKQLMYEYLNFFGIQPPPLTANFIGYPTEITPGSPVNFYDYSTGGVSSWNWSFPGGTPSSSTDQNPVILYTNTGMYDVQLIVDNGVTTDTLLRNDYITVDYATGIPDSQGLSWTVSPNPNPGTFRIALHSLKGDVVSIRILNTLGSPVYQASDIPVNESLVHTVNLPGQPDGIYFLNVKGKESSLTQKIIIRK
jgi:PKD repeat protein